MLGRPPKGETPRVKMTLSIDQEIIDMLDALSYVDRISRSDAVNEAVRDLFAKKELERGEPYPRRK
jgi:metal-responsive CopG/Arc/MetJ family transcriptional regulator